jgi:hypothetical protein
MEEDDMVKSICIASRQRRIDEQSKEGCKPGELIRRASLGSP